jgi:hypothetical protein
LNADRAPQLKANVMRPSMFQDMRDISSFQELDEVMSNLHDCPFDLDRAKFNQITKTWTGIFLSPGVGRPKR